MLQVDKDFTPEDEERLNPCHQISISNALKFLRNPVKCCQHMFDLIHEVIKLIEVKIARNSERMSCEESVIFFVSHAYMTHIRRNLSTYLLQKIIFDLDKYISTEKASIRLSLITFSKRFMGHICKCKHFFPDPSQLILSLTLGET